jgi:hypothetical protein
MQDAIHHAIVRCASHLAFLSVSAGIDCCRNALLSCASVPQG